MQIRFGPCLLELRQGDITDQSVDAIVNAANAELAGGSGVNGAVQRVGGPAIMADTSRLYPDGCPTGSAVVSTAGQLPSRYIFHAVGPVWGGGRQGEEDLLRSAYTTCLELAIQHECTSIAFPAISAGVYGYPADLAANHSLSAVRNFLVERKAPQHVRFVLFSEGMYGAYALALDEIIE
ncbi:MAG: macro domain-containing protein [Planctomycetaceae bacterium]